MKNRKRADRVAATAAERMVNTENIRMAQAAAHQKTRRLVGCSGCNANFFRDVCGKSSVPAHYRVYEGGRVSLCPGSNHHFKKPHVQGVFFQ